MSGWSFLTNHARVLACIANDPGVRLRDVAGSIGITERSAFAIVADLTEAGYVVKEKDGRRNRYSIQSHAPLHEPTGTEKTIGELLKLLVSPPSRRRQSKLAGKAAPRPSRRSKSG
jgi:DNA-binding transcriptional ArsR family regulator